MNLGLQGYDQGQRNMLVALSHHASWIINAVRISIWEQNFKGITPEQLWDPFPEDKEERNYREEVDYFLERFPLTKPIGS